MRHNTSKKEDFYRAKFLLEMKFNTVDDLIRYWSFCGPCIEDCPSVEKYSK
jgi:hypothetical protein